MPESAKFLTTLPLVVLATALSACDGKTLRKESREMLNATLWQQTSGEYEAVTRGIFRQAGENLEVALADPRWTAALEQTGDFTALPPAIVLDLDETILDNTRYEARIIKQHGHFTPQGFAAWCREEDAIPVPGSRAFLEHAQARGVAIFYYSARREHLRECTSGNLRAIGLPFAGEDHLLLDDGRSKSQRRAYIAGRYRILLLVGDNLEDFLEGSRIDPAARRELAQRHAGRWGREWIILPNPMYGHWESSFYDFHYRMPGEEQLQRKLQGLRK
ncbi:MAG: HAD family acid phosphatase [Gammaproteobacteria bacterium]|jgi:acid phosphatase